MKINQISPQDNIFLQKLDSIALKPKMLYYYGNLPETEAKVVAIVGARRNTKYGEEVAYRLAYDLAKKGVIIVSGLAYGIDSIAHRGAVDAGGITIGFLGTEIEKIYPKQHIELA
ncbi:DNA-processing protein DprA, partial [Candidatus Saccharibacteria bacterium]|nr:DNA-processing protein DprA [Candidatus Saccharibacteria bacterium]